MKSVGGPGLELQGLEVKWCDVCVHAAECWDSWRAAWQLRAELAWLVDFLPVSYWLVPQKNTEAEVQSSVQKKFHMHARRKTKFLKSDLEANWKQPEIRRQQALKFKQATKDYK